MGRKEATKIMMDGILKIGGKVNAKLYEDTILKMSDSEFEEYMINLREGKEILGVVIPNNTPNITPNINLCREFGKEPFQRTVIEVPGTNIKTLTDVKSMFMYTPIRKVSQAMAKKIRIAKKRGSVNKLTGQPSGDSAVSKIVAGEFLIHASTNFGSVVKEIGTGRTGDEGGVNAIEAYILKYGSVNLDEVSEHADGNTVTKTIDALFKGIHVDIGLSKED